MSHAGQSVSKANVAAGTYKFNLDGGIYAWSYVGTGAGTVDLKVLGPDNATYLAVATQIVATTGRQSGMYLEPGSYEVLITGFTANYFAVTRVPTE